MIRFIGNKNPKKAALRIVTNKVWLLSWKNLYSLLIPVDRVLGDNPTQA